MKKSLLSLFFGLLAGYASAQHSLTGKVLDGVSGEPLPGANVLVVGSNTGTVSGRDGTFILQELSPQNLSLRISYIGFETRRINLDIPYADELVVSLQAATISAEEFIVAATRASETTPTTFKVISREEISRNNLGQDIPFLLNYTPGVVSHSDAGAGVGYTGLRIRGSDQTRINVTVNGIPMNDAESHGVFWVNMPDFASSVENLQIQRGVGTSTNGAATFGASMNIQTDTKREEAYAETDNGVGSFNTRRHTIKAGTGLLDGKWTVDARLSQITSDGYIDRAFSDLKSYFVSAGYHGDNHVLKFNMFSGAEQTYQAWNGVPEHLLESNRTYNSYTYENETDNYQQDHYQLIYAGNIGSNWRANGALHYTYGRGYYEQFRPNDRLLRNYGIQPIVIGSETIERTDIIRRRWLDNDFYGGVFSLNYVSDNGATDLTFGGGVNRYDGDHFGEIIWMGVAGNTTIRDRYYDNVAVKDDRNLYAKITQEVNENLYLFGDLQYRNVFYRFNGTNNDLRNISGSEDYGFFNPKVGMSYEISPGKTWYASYAVANREPVRRDFTDSPLTEIPRPERLGNLEAGLRVNQSQFQYNFNAYYMGYRDQLVLTGQLNDVGAYVRENVANSYRAGIELDGAYQINSSWSLAGNVALSRNKIQEFISYDDVYDENWSLLGQEATTHSNTDIAFSPNVVAAAIVDYSPVSALRLSLMNKYVGDQYLDNTQNDNRKLDAFWTTDARVFYSLYPRFVKQIDVNFTVYNVFNRLYEPNGYTFSYYVPAESGDGRALVTENFYYPMAGTNFMASISIKF